MKKIIWGCCAALSLAACSGGTDGNYTLNVVLPDTLMNGETAYLSNFDNGMHLDSAKVVDGAIEFIGQTDTVLPAQIEIGGRRMFQFVLEPGTMTYDTDKALVKGTPLNDKLAELTESVDSIFGNYSTELQALKDSAGNTDEILEPLKVLQSRTSDAVMGQLSMFFEENKQNAAGYFAFCNYAYELSSTQLDSSLEGVPMWFRNSKNVQNFLKMAANKEKTAPGQLFTDFEIITSDGKTVHLADYVGKGKYVLVDFWASWCGPCMREMPGLKKIYEKYNGKGLEVLGIAVWDDPADTKKAVEQQQLPWTIIDNAQRIPTDIYGIMGIPHIIMFAPDGTIAFRGLTGEDLQAKVDEVMSEK